MKIEEFIDSRNASMNAEAIDRREDGIGGFPAGSTHWRCMITTANGSEAFVCTMGPAHTSPPDIADVVNCLLLDYSSLDMSPLEFMREFGYSDSVEAERVYNALRAQAEIIRKHIAVLDDLEYRVEKEYF